MENKCKRFLSFLLALAMVIGVMPMGEAKAEGDAAVADVVAKVVNGNALVSLADCEYTYTGGKFAHVVNANKTIYLNLTNAPAANRPYHTSIGEEIAVEKVGNSNAVYLTVGGKYLHYHTQNLNGWNRCGTQDTTIHATGTHKVYLFEKTDNAAECTIIPGYKQVTSLSDGKVYLVAGYNDNGYYYVLRPVESGNNQDFAVKVFATEVPLTVNGTATFRVDGDYTDADTTALNKSVATVGMNGYTRYDVTGVANGVTTIVSGHQYVIYNHRALTNGTGHAPILSNANKDNGLALVHNTADTTVWTITKNENGTYAVKDKDGNYLTLTNGSNNTASVSATACDLTLTYRNNSYWTIGAGNSNLNAHGGTAKERAAGYAADNSHTDGGSFWLLYDVTATLESGSYVISHRTNGKTVTCNSINAGDYGNEGGSGLAVSGNINHVVDADLWQITAVDDGGYYVQNGQNKYLTIAKGTATFTDTPTKLSLVNNGRTWAIGETSNNTTYYLNDFGNKGAAAAGWSTAAGAGGSQWTLYKVTGSVPATAITFTGVGAGTSAVRIGDMTYTAHIHGNSSIVDAVKPTLCEPGHTGKTVCVCGEILSEGEVITQLPVATVLEGNKLVALNACEYTLKLESTQNGKNLYSLSHGAYYVNPAAPTNGAASIPQSTNEYKQLELHWQDVNVGQGNAVHIIGNGGLHFWSSQNDTQSGATNSNKNYWDRCSSITDDPDDREHDLYLFRATGVGTGDVIPGYTKVPKDDVTPGESYLIAGVCDGAWFVMHPSGETTYAKRLDHVAKVESQLHTAAHPWNDATFSDPKICSRCGATEGDPIAPKNAKPLMDNWRDNNRGVVSLSDCEYVLSGTGNGSYSLCNSGFYYVNPDAAKGTGIPQQITPCADLTLNITDGKVEISGREKTLQVNNTANAVNLVGGTKYHPWWHDFDANPSSSTTGFYLLKANPNSTNVNIPGYDIVTEVAVGESYLIAFENGANEWFVMYPSTETVALAMLTKSAGEFGISYANISMENDLEMCFAFEADLVDDWQGCYAVIEKQYADGRDPDTQTVPYSDWESEKIKSVVHNYVIFNGVAAKEMTDQFSVTIYNANDEPISMTHNDSIKEYALRVLNGNYSDAYKKVVVDMLNYGAAAQNAFGYNNAEENLANYGLTEEQKALGTSDPVQYDEKLNLDECPVDYLANVKMVSNLQFMMAFSGINETMRAEVTFYHWDDVDFEKITIECTDFVESGRFHYFTIEETVVADCRQPITCVIKDAEGNTVAEVTDSIASYAGRTQSNKPLYEAIVKFSDSALAYLKLKNGLS